MQRAVFVVAVGVIGVHVVDDSFVNPQPGTRAGDHLVSGLVPLAGLALATVVFFLSSGGLRATIAALTGLFAVAAAAEAYYYALSVGPSGDDFTGLLCLPAGLVLLGLALVLLWRSRRGGRRTWRYTRRALIAAVALVLGVLLVQPFLMGYGYTHLARAGVPESDLGGATYEDVRLQTAEGSTLHGWYLPSANGAAVIALAGRENPETAARFLNRHGYGVLLFDRRGEGVSDGDPNAFGWGDTKDVAAAIAFLRERTDVVADRIGGIGLSVGGEMLLEEAAANPALRAIVSEGAGIRSYREAAELPAQDWPQHSIWAATTAGVALFGNRRPPPNLTELVPRITPRAVFLIYADQGKGGEQLSERYYEVAGGPKELWRTNSGHIGGYDAAPAEYERRVVRFFDTHLGS